MVRAHKWGWKTIAARLLLAPLAVAGVALPAIGQAPPAMKAAPAARTTDPKTLLRQGREALNAGQYDKARALVRQADANNPSGRWGLFDDTPESLEKDIRKAQMKADKVRAVELIREAKTSMSQAAVATTDAARLVALDRAYELADRANSLMGPSDFLGDLMSFGDRPDKLKKEIDVVRLPLRAKVPASQMAKVSAPPKPVVPAAGPNRFTPPTTTTAARLPTTASPMIPTPPANPIIPVSLNKPAVPATTATNTPKVEAAKLLADGRGMLKSGDVMGAKDKAVAAKKVDARFAPSEDSPDQLMTDVQAEAKKQIEMLTKEAQGQIGKKSFKMAEAALNTAYEMAVGMGYATTGIEEQLLTVRKATGTPAINDVSAAPIAAPVLPTSVAQGPTAPKMPTNPVTEPMSPLAMVTPPIGLPTPPASTPVIPAGATIPAPGVPVTPVLPSPAAAPTAVAADKLTGQQLLDRAKVELTRGELTMAMNMALQAHNGNYGVKDEAQTLMRMIDAESASRKSRDSTVAFQSALDSYKAKQYDQALGVLRLIDVTQLPKSQQPRYAELYTQCAEAAAKVRDSGVVPASASEQTPTSKAPPTAGLSDQVKALGQIEYQKLRSEALDTETKAKAAFDRGETDIAIQMMTDFTAKVRGSSLQPGQQNMLLLSIDRRLAGFQIMKRQMDFYTKESSDKKAAQDRIVGRKAADQQRKEEVAKKIREVNELVKAEKFRDAEALALQVKSLEPEDPAVEAVYSLAKRHRAVKEYAKIKEDKEKLFLGGLNGAEKQGPLVDIDHPLEINSERLINSLRRGEDAELYTRSRTSAEREIEMKLDRPFSVEFKNKSLRDALQEIRTKAELNIATDAAAIQDEQISLDSVTVTEKLDKLSLRNILSIVLDQARLKYVVENDVIRVTTEKKAKGRLYTKVFSVMELVTPVPDFALADHQDINKALQKISQPMPSWQQSGASSIYSPNGGGMPGQLVGQPFAGAPGAQPIGGSSPFLPGNTGILENNRSGPGMQSGTGGNAIPSRTQAAAQLMKLVGNMVRPYSWQEMGGAGKLEYYDIGGALVVNQTADVIGEVQDLLNALRRLQDLSLTIEVRIISLSESFFERVGVDFAANIKTSQSGSNSAFERGLATGMFAPEPFFNSIDVNNVTVGWNPSQGGFTPDLNVPIRPNSFGFGVPTFGGYPGPNPNGGLSFGLAFLNDIQVYLFLEAAQGDRRVNVMQAPKVTLFNGQTSTVTVQDTAFFTAGLQVINVGGQIIYLPQNTPLPTAGANLTVQGVVSANRKYVRLTLAPQLNELTNANVPLFPVTAFITPVFEGGSQGVPIPFTQFFQQPSFSSITVQTTVQVPDGGTVVLGGLKTLAEGRNEFGPPVISSIPYLNRLFRNQGTGRETKHIMIMVTPRIVINAEEELNQTGVSSGGGVSSGAAPAGALGGS